MRKSRVSRQEQAEHLVALARAQLGKPYKYGARPWQAPRLFDCSSFVQYLYRRIGIELPRVSIEQARHGKRVVSRQTLKVGDLIFFHGTIGRYNPEFPKGVGHVAMYVGNGRVVHAAYPKGVAEEPLTRVLAGRKPIVLIRRLF